MKDQTYSALSKAAQKIAIAAARQQLAEHIKKRKSRKTFRYNPPQIHRDIMSAMGSRTISDEEAMALLWTYEAMQLRF